MLKVSIVIPVYNAERYLAETLDSIQNQTLQEFEVICVADCPKDGSMEILRKYASQDDRIRIIENTRNIGAGKSRNRGLLEANAPYVCFWDADDIFEPDLLEMAYRTIFEKNTDIVLYEHDMFSGEFQWRNVQEGSPSAYAEPFCLEELPEEALTYWNCVPWNKMYRKEFILEQQLEYQNLPSSNDVYFADMSMLLAERIVHMPADKNYVHHRVNTATQISSNRNPMCAWEAMKAVYDELQKRALFDNYKKYFYIKFLHTVVSDLQRSKSVEMQENTYGFIYQTGAYEVGIDLLKEGDFDNPYYASLLRKFVECEYESRWFEKYALLYAQLEYCQDAILGVYERFAKQNFKMAVWGVGPGGRSVLAFFEAHQKEIHCLIDNDKKKQGTMVEGLRVCDSEEVKYEPYAIFVPNKIYYDEIRCQVERENPENCVIDIMAYLK